LEVTPLSRSLLLVLVLVSMLELQLLLLVFGVVAAVVIDASAVAF
jgi:hypothetical protein